MTAGLSPAMRAALTGALKMDGYVISDATRSTERALIRRGLATEQRGITSRRSRYSDHDETVHDAYLGARLNSDGVLVAREL